MIQETFNLILDRKKFFFELLVEHIEISVISILIAIFFGGFIGIFISEHKKFSKPALSAINFLYTIPSISMLGFLILFFGVRNKSAIVTLVIYALLPMVRNTFTGLNQIEKGILEARESLALKKFQILLYIKIPLAMPIIL